MFVLQIIRDYCPATFYEHGGSQFALFDSTGVLYNPWIFSFPIVDHIRQ